ncbi:MAG: hypothetical protein LBU26_04985 [Synergistaceae bacterium]|nr:hypothetical protein [Synergistaceae bacterium]
MAQRPKALPDWASEESGKRPAPEELTRQEPEAVGEREGLAVPLTGPPDYRLSSRPRLECFLPPVPAGAVSERL